MEDEALAKHALTVMEVIDEAISSLEKVTYRISIHRIQINRIQIHRIVVGRLFDKFFGTSRRST